MAGPRGSFSRPRRGGRTGVLPMLLCTLFASPVAAEAQPSAPDTANVINVRPSGFDARTEEARMSQERLERRLKRSDQAMRAICVGCGSRDAVPGAAPFSPMEALRAPSGTASQMLLPHALPDQVIVEIRQVPVAGPEPLVTEPAPADQVPPPADMPR